MQFSYSFGLELFQLKDKEKNRKITSPQQSKLASLLNDPRITTSYSFNMFLVLNSLLLLCIIFSFAYKITGSNRIFFTFVSIVVGSYRAMCTYCQLVLDMSQSPAVAIVMPLKSVNCT